ncbi:hypothetical protein BJ322DRAFT_1026298 [Thelephora terrestris]|uniref:Transmembrane protein n=1 Tax=Thelephora terrestris TaxID=56493 RepID=A0A9P6LB27_9AGAM|nr:hypothetical protein BJ322DRAFT_1026298 [Thelephora terrestris]
MACTGCQNASIQTWQFWRFYCDAVYITQYPNIIPYTTAVPHWAYLNYTVGGTFDPVLAKAAGGPESLSPVPPTLSTSVSPAHTDPPATTQGNDNGNGGKKSSHVGAIVGGVIGGLAALAVIGATWMFLRKRAAAHGDGDYPDYTKVYPGGVSSSEHAHEIPPSQPRLYDPSDPSTYPSHIDHVSSVPYTTVPQSGRYSGVPEL